jgi:Asp-tRNA(Asn)/Glu-tRNA(Gln) amidotransferase A subunit family amidase
MPLSSSTSVGPLGRPWTITGFVESDKELLHAGSQARSVRDEFMPLTRREALRNLGALFALPLVRWPERLSDPLSGTIVEYQAGRARGDWSAAQVVREALDRARAWNGTLHAIDMFSPTAIDDARASDARARRRALRGPLDGVPVFAKSIYDMSGLPTTGSSAEWARLFPEAVRSDAIEVARMRAAGAVVLGKTAADDFAYHGNGTSTLSGQVRNPYDPAGVKTPGGSSAGSAVSVACGIAFAAVGTDDGGSNRIPAQFCGVVGMKPTFGLVPRTGVIPTWPYLDTHGPLARHVADAALLLDAIAGPDRSDGLALVTPRKRGGLAHLSDDALVNARLGIVEAHVPRAQMTAESLFVFDRAVADLKSAGAIVEACAPTVTRANVRDLFAETAKLRGDVKPDPDSPAPTANALFRYFATHGGDPRRDVERGLAAYQKYYDVLPKDWDEMSKLITQPYESDPAGVSFARSRAAVTARLAVTFREQRLDAMIYPTMPFPAPRAVDPWPDIRTTLGYGNWLGLPEVSVPTGLGADGMPAGNISFVGLPGSDARLLALAHSYERKSRRFVAPPSPA